MMRAALRAPSYKRIRFCPKTSTYAELLYVNQVKKYLPKLQREMGTGQHVMGQASEHLKNCASVSDLKREIRSLCARFGSILHIDVLLARRNGTRQAMCFWRMESPEREDEVMSEFGVGRFGGDLVVIVDLEPGEVQQPVPFSPPLH